MTYHQYIAFHLSQHATSTDLAILARTIISMGSVFCPYQKHTDLSTNLWHLWSYPAFDQNACHHPLPAMLSILPLTLHHCLNLRTPCCRCPFPDPSAKQSNTTLEIIFTFQILFISKHHRSIHKHSSVLSVQMTARCTVITKVLRTASALV